MNSPDDLIGSAVDALRRRDVRAACELYEQAARATLAYDVRAGAHLLITAAIYAHEQPQRRDALQAEAQLHRTDIREFDHASEVAFGRAANAEEAGLRSEALSLNVASIVLAGQHLAERAYEALADGHPVVALQETTSRIEHALRAIQRLNPGAGP